MFTLNQNRLTISVILLGLIEVGESWSFFQVLAQLVGTGWAVKIGQDHKSVCESKL